MEHRLFRRFVSDHPVEIHQGHRCIVQARVRNVSREGALLEADDGPMLSHGHLELELKANESKLIPRRLRGMVVYRDDRKLGVMFLDTWSDSEWQALTSSDDTAIGPIRAGRIAR